MTAVPLSGSHVVFLRLYPSSIWVETCADGSFPSLSDPLDHQLQVIKSGGVTTSLILPGSGNNMGGEAYVVKHAVGQQDGRTEISAEDMLADPDKNWRYMKMACGENAKRVYGRLGRDFGPFSRLGEAWYFRHAFEQATAMVNAQDDWCAATDKSGVESMQSYLPQELKWESLGALLRGQVRLNKTTSLDDLSVVSDMPANRCVTYRSFSIPTATLSRTSKPS